MRIESCSRHAMAIALALLVGACATADPYVSPRGTRSGYWLIERQTDRVTGEPISSAHLVTRNSSHSGLAFPQPAQLQLSCFKGEPLIRFVFEFKVGSNRNSTLGYVFDDKPGHETEARFLQDYRTAVIEDKDEVAQFARELATSKMLYVRITSINAGRSTAEFRLDGAPEAVTAGFAGCPLPGETQAKAKPA